MSLKLSLIFVSASVWCFASQLSAQNVTLPDNLLMTVSQDNNTTLNDTTLIDISLNETSLNDTKLIDTAIDANLNEEVDQNGNEDVDPQLDELDNLEYENDWEKSDGKQQQAEKYENDENYSNKYEEQDDRENWIQENKDKNRVFNEENRKIHKWGKNTGEVLFKKWKWAKEHGSTKRNGKNKRDMRENIINLYVQKEGIKNQQQEEKAYKNRLKDDYIAKAWEEYDKINDEQVINEPELKSWNDKKPIYAKYQKELELFEKKAKKQGFVHVDSILGYAVDKDRGYKPLR